ncbi:hypothetical protein [Nonomuraea endophytica]|uniref:hypothetical protein n=1 Tax=Nonomuraea endophytica TaxID=714136 RepID=UPI0037CA3008
MSALQRAARDELASTAGGVAAVEGFIRRVVADIGRLPHLKVHHAEFGNYGSGYASYVDVFVTRRRSGEAGPDIEGLSLALCRLAPFAALFMPGIRSSSFHELPRLSRVADGDVVGWEEECRELRHVLDRHGIALLDSRILSLPLDPRLRVETVLGDPPYRVFDAWFHWID